MDSEHNKRTPFSVDDTLCVGCGICVDTCPMRMLSAWLALCNTASPQDPDSDYMKRVHERRKTVQTLLQENDPGMGPLHKFLGNEKARLVMSIVEP